MDTHFKHCTQTPCTCEMHSYWLLVLIALGAAAGEFTIAWFFAKSGAATVDALHMFLHGLWYVLALGASWHVASRRARGTHENRIRARYGIVNFFFLIVALAAFVIFEAIPRLLHPEPVASGAMLIAVLIGLCGNIAALCILKKVRRDHETYHWLTLDTLADFWLSIAIIVSVPFVNIFPLLDPLLTLIGICWIAKVGYSLFFSKTVKNL